MPDFNIYQIIEYIMSPELQSLLFPIRIIFLIFSLFLLISICYFLFKTSYLKARYFEDSTEFFNWKDLGAKKTIKQWAKIMKQLDKESKAEWKIAIIEADNLLDSILKRGGQSGKTKKERLEGLTADIVPNIEELKEVRKIKNDIIKNSDYKLEHIEARRILEIYRETFSHLGLL